MLQKISGFFMAEALNATGFMLNGLFSGGGVGGVGGIGRPKGEKD